MTREFIKHEIEWTRAEVSRFWDHLSTQKSLESAYYSKQFGETLIDLVLSKIPRPEMTLDFGCGPGFLLERLSKASINNQGLDFSGKSVEEAHRRLGKDPCFRGAVRVDRFPSPFPDGTFDLVFFIETLEHLPEEILHDHLRELHRLVQPGKFLFVTTPNQEDLEFKKAMCPECGCVFHRVQHVTSWDEGSLVAKMQEYGFQKVFCQPFLLLPRFGLFPGFLLARWYRIFYRLGLGKELIRYLPFGTGDHLPHLVYIGRKKDA